jgi:predicted lipoprotein with Yx(FWY)xxD motif
MHKMSKLAFPGVVAAAALLAAACGSGGGSGNPYGQSTASISKPTTAQAAPSTAPAASPSTPASVAVADTRLGPVIVDRSGRTLYVFDRDIPDVSTCYEACAMAWPPLLTAGSPAPGQDVNGADLGTTARSNGAVQVTFHGRPLYLFAGDEQPGDTMGQGLDAFGARWYAVSVGGAEITAYRGPVTQSHR